MLDEFEEDFNEQFENIGYSEVVWVKDNADDEDSAMAVLDDIDDISRILDTHSPVDGDDRRYIEERFQPDGDEYDYDDVRERGSTAQSVTDSDQEVDRLFLSLKDCS